MQLNVMCNVQIPHRLAIAKDISLSALNDIDSRIQL